jgi:hypothetical protein
MGLFCLIFNSDALWHACSNHYFYMAKRLYLLVHVILTVEINSVLS